jgi:hypothetical protein
MPELGVALDAPWAGQTFSPPLSTGLGAVEQALVDRLRCFARDALGSTEPLVVRAATALRQVGIDHFPDNPDTFRLVNQVGQVLVCFNSAQGSHHDPLAIDEVVQRRALKWDFVVIVRDLGWAYGSQPSGTSPGAYALLDALRLALTGYEIPGFSKLVWQHEKFMKRTTAQAAANPGVWMWEMQFAHVTGLVEFDFARPFPIWTRSDFQERADLTTVMVPASAYTFDATGAIQLPYANVNAVVVTDPGAPDAPAFAERTDYTVDRAHGLILAVPGGDLAAGDTVNVGFGYAEISSALAPSIGGGPDPTAPTN